MHCERTSCIQHDANPGPNLGLTGGGWTGDQVKLSPLRVDAQIRQPTWPEETSLRRQSKVHRGMIQHRGGGEEETTRRRKSGPRGEKKRRKEGRG